VPPRFQDVPPATVLGVSAFNRLARDLVESSLPLMWVRGEVSNFTCAASGHCYFSLKDAGAQVRCVFFRHRARLLDWRMENGLQVEVRATATIYEARGEFQLTVETARRAGLGALFEAFERLKAKLGQEGLFDAERKRPLPPFPETIGVVTSTAGAALRDVLTVLARRMPAIRVVVYPTLVQGASAPASIAAAIGAASARAEIDALIVCRGGGSIEDLWAFNDEAVARAIHACSVPVVSGVGHETDFTIADFVADLRAPTPSAAAEAVSADGPRILRHLQGLGERASRATWQALERHMQRLDYLARRLVDPRERIVARARHVELMAARLQAAFDRLVDSRRWALSATGRRLGDAAPDIAALERRVEQSRRALVTAAGRHLDAHAARLGRLEARLGALDPHAVLERGYAIATAVDGGIVRDAAALAEGDRLTITFARGRAGARVERVEPDGD
jgi:exodeoxyribonuclease VII large subunit